MLFAMKHCQTRLVIMKPNVPPSSTSDDQPTIVSLSVFNFPFATLINLEGLVPGFKQILCSNV